MLPLSHASFDFGGEIMTETEFKNLWRKRDVTRLECPGGSVCLVRRPGPELALKIGRLQRTLKPLLDVSKGEGEAVETPEELTLAIARETVAAAVVKPRLYVNPEDEQLGVDDIEPADFWHIFNYVADGAREQPVETERGETTVGAVESFPAEQESGAGSGDHGGDVSEPQSIAASGDS
jgi:hypothetical protein